MASSLTDKRLRNELKDLRRNRMDNVQVIQDETNKYVFYFLMEGDPKSDYNNGYYIGKLLLPNEYPSKPGDFLFLTPNGRFTVDQKVCMSNTGYHADEWAPTWSIRNIVLGIVSVFNDDKEHGLNMVREPSEIRRKYAKESIKFNLTNHANIFKGFTQFVDSDGKIKSKEQRDKEKKEYEEKRKLKKLKKQQKNVGDDSLDDKEELVEEKHMVVEDDSPKKEESKKEPSLSEKRGLIDIDNDSHGSPKQESDKNDDESDCGIEIVKSVPKLEKIVSKVEKPVQLKCTTKSSKICSSNSMTRDIKNSLIKQYLSEIRNMTYETFNIVPFKKVAELQKCPKSK